MKTLHASLPFARCRCKDTALGQGSTGLALSRPKGRRPRRRQANFHSCIADGLELATPRCFRSSACTPCAKHLPSEPPYHQIQQVFWCRITCSNPGRLRGRVPHAGTLSEPAHAHVVRIRSCHASFARAWLAGLAQSIPASGLSCCTHLSHRPSRTANSTTTMPNSGPQPSSRSKRGTRAAEWGLPLACVYAASVRCAMRGQLYIDVTCNDRSLCKH